MTLALCFLLAAQAPNPFQNGTVSMASPIERAEFTADGKTLVTYSGGAAWAWDVATGAQKTGAAPPTSPAFEIVPDSKTVYQAVRLAPRNAPDDPPLATLDLKTWPAPPPGATWSEPSYSPTAKAWVCGQQTRDGEATTLAIVRGGNETLATFPGAKEAIAATSRDGRTVVAMVRPAQGTPYLVDVATKRRLTDLDGKGVDLLYRLAVADGGRRAAFVGLRSGGGVLIELDDPRAKAIAFDGVRVADLSPDFRYAAKYQGWRGPSYAIADYKLWLRTMDGTPAPDGFGAGRLLSNLASSAPARQAREAAATEARMRTAALDALDGRVVEFVKKEGFDFVAKRVGANVAPSPALGVRLYGAPEFAVEKGVYTLVALVPHGEKTVALTAYEMDDEGASKLGTTDPADANGEFAVAAMEIEIRAVRAIRATVDGEDGRPYRLLLFRKANAKG